MSTGRQHFSMPISGSTCNQSLRESQLPGLWINVECTSSPCSLTTPLQSYVCLGHPSLPRNLGGCTQDRGFSWGPPRRIWILGDLTLVLEPDGRVTIGVHRQTRQLRFKRGLKAGHPTRRVYPNPVRPWESDLPWSQGLASIPCQGHWGNKLGNTFLPFLFL